MITAQALAERYQEVKRRYMERDVRMERIHAARNNELERIAPGLFPEEGPLTHPVIANTIDVAARDMGEQVSPLPTITCSSAHMVSDRDMARAGIRTKIAGAYLLDSRLGMQMQTGAEWLVSYGFLPALVEPNHTEKRPEIRLVDPRGVYPVYDRMRRLIAVYQAKRAPISVLCEQYPELEDAIAPKDKSTGRRPTGDLEIVFYHDKDIDLAFIPGRDGLVLASTPNPYGKVMWRVAQRPGLDEIPRGQFDDAVWVQVMRNAYALMKFEALEKSIHAPTAVPQDVQHVPIGPSAILRSANPQMIRKVGLELPQGAFQADALMEEEVRKGARYPESRSGNASQSIVTGRGVQELSAGFDSQISSYQAGIADMLRDIIGLCFVVDEMTWPDEAKKIRGTAAGSPFEITYTPARDIKGDYTCEVTYGLMAGLAPNQALIYILQSLGANLISKDTARRQMPGQIDIVEEERKIDAEKLDQIMIEAVAQYAQAIPQLAAQGQDPTHAVQAIALVAAGRAKGEPIAALVSKAFGVDLKAAQQQAEQPPAAPQAPAEQGAPGVAVPPGQGQPDLMSLMAGIGQGGKPRMTANVAGQIPA